MNEFQRQLYEQLLNGEPISSATSRFTRTMEQFVIDYGWWYDPSPLPDGFESGKAQQCHKNAYMLSAKHNELIYCEGFALSKDSLLPTLHSWVTDGQGRALDNTWQEPGIAYAGVPFKYLFVTKTTFQNGASISLLDDWQNNHPLRGELGDLPDEWYERAGEGLTKILS
ncbi:hypothetical protein [Gimesia algae]|uniref:Uncharacterized protein n=1 Tax=Gimesia algae TaxID=2527971 RepID=A0A517VFF2_9PLAN|nr:hypothetical protein [Gimesia algae]QDT91731.1 hypothetical protein Pan161_33940 [Gimesia algae]